MITCRDCDSWKIEARFTDENGKEYALCPSCNCAKRKPVKEKVRVPLLSNLSKKKIAKFSNRNTYKTSSGERFTKAQIETKVKAAKLVRTAQFLKEHGFLFCEDCKTNQGPFDRSHELSVDECQKQGTTEYAWDINNIKIRCRVCHGTKDRNIINYKSNDKI